MTRTVRSTVVDHALNLASYGAVTGANVTSIIEQLAARAFTTSFAAGSGMAASTGIVDTLYLPPGDFTYDGAGLNYPRIRIIGAGPQHTRLTLGSSAYLVNTPTAITSIHLEGFQVNGGKGLFRHAFTGVNVAAPAIFRNLWGIDYSECFIGTMASDYPYWLIDDVLFRGIVETSIGVAHAGDASGGSIMRCKFDRNRYHIKTGRGGRGLRIINNDFIRLNSHVNPNTDIWVVPYTSFSTAGTGFTAAFNKFGPENLASGDFRILFADADGASGADFLSQSHSANASTGYVNGHSYAYNEIAGTTAAIATPFISSTTDNVAELLIGPNHVTGTPPAYWLQLLSGATADRTADTNLVISNVGYDKGREILTTPVCNVAGYVSLIDPMGMNHDDPMVVGHLPGSGADIEYQSVLSTAMSGYTTSNATITSGQADSVGTLTAIEVDYSTNAGQTYASFTPVGSRPHWIEVDLKAAGTNPIAAVVVQINGATAPIYFNRIVKLPTAWRRFRFRWTPRISSAVRFTIIARSGSYVEGTTDRVLIGRARIYVAREPVNTGPIHLGPGTARIYNGTGSPEAVVTATVGSLFIRTDGGTSTTLFIKETGSAATGWRAV